MIHVAGWGIDVIPILFQTGIDVIDSLSAGLNEANVECTGIFDFGGAIDICEREHHSILIPQESDEVGGPLSLGGEPEIFDQKVSRQLDIRDGKIEMVQNHGVFGSWRDVKSLRTIEDNEETPPII